MNLRKKKKKEWNPNSNLFHLLNIATNILLWIFYIMFILMFIYIYIYIYIYISLYFYLFYIFFTIFVKRRNIIISQIFHFYRKDSLSLED